MMRETLSPYFDFITETAYQAGRLTLGYYQTGIQAEFKSDETPVTVADRKAEEFIRSRIESRYPTHAIVGEEYGLKESQGETYRWFVDPIDGTKSFLRGVPLYAVLIGLEIEGVVRVGAAYFPALDEMLAAASGSGAWWNGKPARVSNTQHLSQSLVTCTSSYGFKKYGRLKEWNRIQDACYFQAGWGDAYGYLLVATGRADLMLDPAMNVWDCGPFPPILEEAGGYFGDWNGKPTIYGNEAMAMNRDLLPQALSIIHTEE
jgi:myo-inositol-1(or 4)-monophosphatase